MNAALCHYAHFLLEWNAIHNLSGAKTIQAIKQNINDSLQPLSIKPLRELLSQKKRILDIGSGNGFPAIPLALALGIEVILCESNAKKAAFLQNCKVELGLELQIKRQRAECLELEEWPDLITSRAAMSVGRLFKSIRPYLNKQCDFLLYKGSEVKKEIPQAMPHEIFLHGKRRYLLIYGRDVCNGSLFLHS